MTAPRLTSADLDSLAAIYPRKESEGLTYVTHRRDAQRELVRRLQDGGVPGVMATRLAVDVLRTVAAYRLEEDAALSARLTRQARHKCEDAGREAAGRLMGASPAMMTTVVEAARAGAAARGLHPMVAELLTCIVTLHAVPT